MAPEGMISVKLGEAVAYLADVDLSGCGAVGLQVGGQFVAFAESARHDPGPGVCVPGAEQR